VFPPHVPFGLTQIFQGRAVLFESSAPKVLDRVSHAKAEVLGYLDALDIGGVAGIVARMVDGVVRALELLQHIAKDPHRVVILKRH
jgi:hypothetical protein